MIRHFLVLALSASLGAQGLTATINDAQSHGTLGDNLLSLDETFQVLNESIQLSQLSAGERAQITGSGTSIDKIVIDAATTPTITLQRLLSPIDGPAAHVDFSIEGQRAANGNRPVLDGGTLDVVLRSRSNHTELSGLDIRNGKAGVIADSSVHQHPSEMFRIDDCTFSGQTLEGVRLQNTGAAKMLDAVVTHTDFAKIPTGVVVDDKTTNGMVMFTGEWLDFDGVTLGIDLFTQGMGAMSGSRLWRSNFANGEQVLKVRRSATSTQRLMLMLVDGTYVTSGDTIDVQGNAVADNILHHHHLEMRPATGKRAFNIWPQDGRFDFHGSENTIYGDMDLLTGRLNRRLWAWNTVFRDGTITFSNVGVQTDFRWNKFENCTIRALSTNGTRMPLVSSEFYGCTVDGQSSTGPIVLDNCYLERTTLSGQASRQNDAPSPWLGLASSSARQPLIGGPLDLTLRLPPGMGGVWHVGLSLPRPVLTDEPWRIYFNVAAVAPLNGFHVNATTIHLTVPDDTNLVGMEYYFQPVTIPIAGQSHVPAFNLPRGIYVTPIAR